MKTMEEMYRFLTYVNSDMDYEMLKTFLMANCIPITRKEKGFGGPIRNIYMGNLGTANIEVYVDPENYDAAKALMETDFSELAEDAFDGGENPETKNDPEDSGDGDTTQ